jgi:hypothetical protein
MDAPDHDLQVACRPSLAHDGDVAFDAERLLPSPSALWVLYVHSDQTAVDIHKVVPEPIGHALHSSGALGLLFTDRVTSVQLHIAAGNAGHQRWRFWVDDEPDVTEASNGEALGAASALTPMSA